MKKNKILLSIIVLMLIIVLGFSVVYAENLQDLQDRKEELNENIKDAKEEISSIKVELTENLKKINELEGQISEYNNSLEAIRVDLKATENEIAETTEKLEVLIEKYNNQKEMFQKRLVALYETGETTYLDVLLNSKSVSSFVANYYLIGEIASIDNDLLTTIEMEKNEIEEIKKELDEKKNSLKEKEETEKRTLITLNNTKKQKDNVVATLTAQEQEIRNDIKKYEAEINSIEAQIDTITRGITGGTYTGGMFAWPVPGYKTITSPYGGRIHPVLKTYRMHTGIDIGAPTGAYIIAANAGTVVESRYMGGYGNAVIIDHGGGYSTLYGHGSALLVKAGDKVARGDVIMKCGSTGWSTGPHLHFEVRINGNHVSPLQYLVSY